MSTLMSALAQDLRYFLRSLAKSPGFAAAAVVSLALGIGANTSLFSVMSALLLHPLPYRDAERLVILWNRSPGLNITEDWFSTAQYFDIKSGQQSFEDVAIAIGGNYNLTGRDAPQRVGTIRVSSNLLPMLGAQAALGRLFVPQEDSPGQARTAVLSYGAWARRFGADRNVVGTSITLNGMSYQIAGVLPESFSLPREVLPTLGVAEDGEIFLPLPLAPSAAQVRDHEDYNIMAKLNRGVTVRQARAEMDALTARLRRDFPVVYPPNGGLTFGVVPLQEQVVGDVRRTLLILMASVGLVLLIACTNVANLLLSRAVARQKEMAVRSALGASGGRILRQLLTESVVLALCGGLLGTFLAVAGVKWIHVVQPKSIPRLQAIAVNFEVLGFTLLLSILSGVLFGLAPALRVRRLDLNEHLAGASRGSSAGGAVWGRGGNLRRLLAASELAFSVVLLIGAGLLIRSFVRLQGVEPGFDSRGVLTFELTLTGRKYGDGQAVLNTYRQLWDRLGRLPGVTASGGVTSLPLSQYFAWGPITVEGRTPPPGEEFINADERVAGGAYFQAMHIPLRRGRLFDEHDTASAPRVVLVDEHMAREMWPNEDPIGKRIHLGGIKTTAPWLTVVGVVGRVKQYGLDADSRIAFYMPQTQVPSRAMYVAIHTGADPAALSAAVQREVRAIDPDLPVYHVRPMDRLVELSLARREFAMLLLAMFAGLALALAAIGIYGVMAYLVSQGVREIGIRMALGATQRGILRLVLLRGMAIACTGLAGGLAVALALTRFLRSLLFGITATDPFTFILTPAALALIALAAVVVPARRAARVDPIEALRIE